MLVNIWVKDNCTGNVHQVGTDPHDSLELWNGVVQYVNMQCMEGTKDGAYSFVDTPDVDDYVMVTPDELLINKRMIHKDLLEHLKNHPDAIKNGGGNHEQQNHP